MTVRVSRDYLTPATSGPSPLVLDVPGAWVERALCAETDPEVFFPERGGSSREAKAVCGRCEVTDECLAYALDNGDSHGIFGGKSERERRKIRGPEKTCPSCGGQFIPAIRQERICSDACRAETERKRQAAQYARRSA